MEEGESTPLAAQRAAAESHEAALRAELLVGEIGDAPLAPLVQEARKRIDQVTPQRLEAVEVRHLPGCHRRREVELRARAEPVREVVALRVVVERFRGDFGRDPEHAPQVAGAADLAAVGHLEYEVAEAESIDEKAPYLLEQRGVALVDELGPQRLRHPVVGGDCGLEKHRQVGVLRLHLPHEISARLRVVFAVAGDAYVGDEPQQVVGVVFVVPLRFFEAGG